MAVVEDAPSLFRAADGGATLALLAKLTVETAQQCKMEEARNKLQVNPLFVTYQRHTGTSSLPDKETLVAACAAPSRPPQHNSS